MSMNLRELIHVYKLRTHSSAQEEISNLIKEMVNLVLSESPEIKNTILIGGIKNDRKTRVN